MKEFSHLLILIFSLFTSVVHGQTANYSQGSLDVDISRYHPCDGNNSGYISFTVNSVNGGVANIQIFGPESRVTRVAQGDTFIFFTGNTPQADSLGSGNYNIQIFDDPLTTFINSFSDPVNYPPLVLADLATLQTNSVTSPNNSCSSPDGQIEISLNGGSQDLPGGGSYSYTINSDNGVFNSHPGSFDGTGTIDFAQEASTSGLPGGTYTIDIEDDYSVCSISETIEITDPSPEEYNITTSSPQVLCDNEDLVLELDDSEGPLGTYGIVTYEVYANGSHLPGYDVSGIDGPLTFTIDAADVANGDVFTIVGTNGSCADTEMNGSVTVTKLDPITATATITNATCSGSSDGQIVVNASGGNGNYTYSLDGGAFQPSNTFGSLSAGNYTVTIQDDLDCEGTESFEVTEPNAISIDATSSTPVACDGDSDGTVTVTASGGTGTLTYEITPGGTTNNTGIFNGLTAGDYTVSVTDANNCGPEVSAPITVAEPAPIAIDSETSTPITCNGETDGTITVTASGGTGALSYTLSPGNINNATGIFTGLGAGDYTVSVTDANACTPATTGTLTIVEPSVIVIDSETSTPTSCNGDADGTVTVTASGGTGTLTYEISPGGATNATGIFTGLTAGDYTVSVTDVNNCDPAQTATITVDEPDAISIDATSSTPVSCDGDSDGTVTVIASGGTGTLSYEITPGGTTNNTGIFNGLTAGDYTVSVTDANNCGPEVSAPITVAEPAPIAIDSETSTPITCNGETDGTITVTASGGTGALSYTLSPGNINNATGIFTGLGAGDYTVSVTDANACTPATTGTLTIVEPSVIVIDSETSTPTSCNGDADGTVTVTASGGTGTLTYEISPGGATNATGIFTGLTAGDYTVSVTDVNNCDPAQSGTITVGEPNAISIDATSSTPVSCDGDSDGTVTVTASGGTGTLTYEITPGGTTNNTGIFNGLSAGDYTVSVTDANNCGPELSAPITVAEPTPIAIDSETSTPITCNGETDGTITVTASGGTGALSYTLSPGNINNATGIFTGLGAGDYTVSVTDVNACTPATTGTLTIVEPSVITIDSETSTPTSCNGDADGTVTVTASGGTGTLTYEISPGGATNTTGIFTGLTAGDYTVSVTDVNNCDPAQTATITVGEPDAISIDATSSTPVSCDGDSDGTVTVTASGGTGTLSYEITPGGATNNTGVFTGLAPGGYTVAITDASTCDPVQTGTITVGEPDAISIDATSSTPVACDGDSDGTVTVTASGGTGTLTYEITPGGTTNNTGIFNGLSAGDYTVSVTDANNCGPEATAPITVSEPAPIAIDSETSTPITCNGETDGTITVTASGGTGALSYTLSPGSITNATGSFTGLGAGDYTVSVTDANACTPATTGTLTILEPSVIAIDSENSTPTSCNGDADGTVTVTASGGTGTLTYEISPGGATNTTGIFTGLTAGDYTVSVTDVNNCDPAQTATITVDEPDAISIDATSSTPVSCDGDSDGTVTVIASGGTGTLSYEITPGGTTNNTGIFNGLTAGDYTVSVTDANNCGPEVSAPITVAEPAPIAIDSETSTPITCNGETDGTITVTASGGTGALSYTLSPGNINNATGIFTGLGAGDYTVSVTDANACTPATTGTLTIVEPSVIVIDSETSTPTSCNGDADGTVTVTAIGGTGTLTYEISPGGATNATGIFTGLTAGDYTVSVTDVNNCDPAQSGTITVGEPNAISIDATSSTPVSCDGDSDGTVTVTASGGTGTLTYEITPGGTTNNTGIFNGLSAGDYTVSVTDANNCGPEVSAPITVSEPDPIAIDSETSTPITCNGETDGTITVTASGGTGALSYTLSPGSITNATGIFTGLGAGDYTVFVTDANNCGPIGSGNLSISEPDELLLSSTGNIVLDCFGDTNGSGTFTASGGIAGYTFDVIENTSGATITNDATTLSFTDAGAGDIEIEITDANGCSATSTLTITEPAELVLNNSGDISLDCAGDTDGVAIFFGSGGVTPYSYTIDSNTTGGTTNPVGPNLNLTGAGVGSIEVTVTDANGCTATSTLVVDGPANPIVFTNTGNITLLCNGDTDGSGSFDASGGVGAFTFTLLENTTGATITEDTESISFSDAGAGTITYSVSDENDCSATSTIIVSQPAQLQLTNSGDVTLSCFGDSNGSGSFEAVGGTAPYTFILDENTTGATLDDTDNPATFTGASIGVITYTITDANNCQASSTITITENPELTASAVATDITTCGETDGTIDVTVSGGVTPYTYLWSNGEETEDLSTLSEGTYEIIITDAAGCTTILSETILEPTAPVFNITVAHPTTCGEADGSITTNVSGGQAPYTYSWNTGSTDTDLTDLVAGIYTVTVTDENGCSATEVIDVNDPASFTLSSVVTDVTTCEGNDGTIDLSFTGGTMPFTFAWNTGADTEDLTGLSSGTYTVIATDFNGCSLPHTVIVGEPAEIILDGVVTDASACGGSDGAVDLIVTGGTSPFTYVWDNGANTEDISGLIAGEYSVEVFDNAGCSATLAFTVTEPEGFTLDATQINVSTCAGSDGSIDLEVIGGVAPYIYDWDNGADTEDISGLSASTYTVVVTDDVGCTNELTVTITEPAGFAISISSSDVTTCEGTDGAIDLEITGGMAPFTYDWDNDATTEDLADLPAGDYTVIVTDANLCSGTITTTITEPAGFTLAVTTTDVTTCSGDDGSINLEITGGTAPFTYDWDNGATTEDITGLMAGTYTVNVTDANNCTGTISATIGEPSGFTLNTTAFDATTCGGTEGSVELELTGGTSPFTFTWSNGEITEDLSTLPAGDYTVNVSDANGCTGNATVTVGEPSGFTVDATATDPTSCGAADGTISLTLNGGTAPYTFAWDNGADTQDLSGLEAGTYSVTVTDDLGCTGGASITINDPVPFTANFFKVDVSTCSGNDGSINLSLSGGSSPYSFLWSNGETTEDISGLVAGTYSVEITDNSSCSATYFIDITEPVGIELTATAQNATSCGTSDGAIDLTVTGGTAPFTYAWSNGEVTEDLTGLAAGSYDVLVTDDNGCTASISRVITEPAGFSLSTNINNNVVCGGANGAINLTITGGTAPFTYNWNTGQNTEDISNLLSGVYTVTVTDASGCASSVGATVVDPSGCGGSDATCSLFSINFENSLPSCGQENGVVQISMLTYDGAAIDDYRISLYRVVGSDTILDVQVPNPQNDLISGRQAGNYYYEILDFSTDLTCEGGFELPFITTVSADTVAGTVQHINCFGNSNGAVQVSVSDSETGQYFYSIDGGYNWTLLPGSRMVSGLSAGFNTIQIGEMENDICPAELSVVIESANPEIKITRDVTSATCDNNDGALQITGVTGGSGIYDYRFNGVFYSELPTDGLFSNLASGSYIFTVIDEMAACEKDFEIIVTFPGLVQFTTNAIAPDCDNGNIINGEIQVVIEQAGVFDVGISEEQNSDPGQFFEVTSQGDGNVVYTFEDIDQGSYYITVIASGAVCPNRRLVEIQEGPRAVDFTPEQLCIDNVLALQVKDITGERTSPFDVEIYRNGVLNPMLTETFTGIPNGDFVYIESIQSKLGPGNYEVRITQQQSACPDGQLITSALKPIIIRTPLQARVASTTISPPHPELPVGTIVVSDFIGGHPAYLISAFLDSAASPEQTYLSDFDTVRFNPDLQYEYIFQGLPAGRYAIEVMDTLGCYIELVGRVGLNTNLFIPNVFTPNGDNKNETFRIRNLPEFDVELIVTNRWGKQVYSSDSYSNDWDGGDNLDGVYFYQLNVAGEKYNGWVQIVRGKIE